MPMVAWYMLSKESYMKRVIREVLPTVVRMCLGQLSGTSPRGYRPQRPPQRRRAYRSVRPGTPVWEKSAGQVAGRHGGGRGEGVLGAVYLNFFNGLLYDPPAPVCAMTAAV